MAPSVPVPVEERALDLSKKALGVSRYALWASTVAAAAAIASVIVGAASCQQAQTANETTQASRAANVYFDTERAADGTVDFFIVNRNVVPVNDVSFDYRVGGFRAPERIFVGLIPACTSVQARPPRGVAEEAGYRPTSLYLRDVDGRWWTRDETGRLSRSASGVTNPAGNKVIEGMPVEGGC